ncbi:MAG: hypothetical protein JWP87_755 [Labilithrix sp.]|nr:hypothetical protein [Labilithrix sp.]
MGDSRGAPGFGQVDLDIEEDLDGTVRPPESSSVAAAGAFGDIDLDSAIGDEEPAPPPSRSRVFGPETTDKRKNVNTRATRKNMSAPPPSVHDESTRIVSGDALSHITRPPPPNEDGSTRAWDQIDEALLAVGREEPDDAPPSSRSGNQPAPSASGVASHGGRVAAMRELYAKGDADGALALAATLGETMPPGYAGDHPDASIVVEFGEQSIDLNDPFGGLIPLDDELAAMPTAAPPKYVPSVPVPQTAPTGAVAQLTLTQRQSIPRLLKSMGALSKLKIDHRAGFLLAHVDGMQTLEEILDICAMPPADALELIANLKTMGVIDFD